LTQTSRAWLHKENFEGFWDLESRWHGQRYLRDWYNSAIRSRLEPIKRVAHTLKAHTTGLINYFTHHITNAVTEGLNSRIQNLKSAARGFRNFHHYGPYEKGRRASHASQSKTVDHVQNAHPFLLRQTRTPTGPLRLKKIPRKSPKKLKDARLRPSPHSPLLDMLSLS
jgi:hypothetical protein